MDRNLLNALALTIAEAGERGAPSGHLYAALMGRCTLDEYNAMLAVLTRGGLVTLEHHLLRPTALLIAGVDEAKAAEAKTLETKAAAAKAETTERA